MNAKLVLTNPTVWIQGPEQDEVVLPGVVHVLFNGRLQNLVLEADDADGDIVQLVQRKFLDAFAPPQDGNGRWVPVDPAAELGELEPIERPELFASDEYLKVRRFGTVTIELHPALADQATGSLGTVAH